MFAVACGTAGSQGPRFVVEHAWSGSGEWIPADLHIHTRFSDGRHPVDVMAARATEHGCRAIAITDHADRGLTAATPEYAAAIEAARRATPGLVILSGLEWNIPPRGGDEHASVLVPPGALEWETLAEFKERFDDYELGDRPKPDVVAALRWLESRRDDDLRPLVVYNHPSRKDASPLDNVADIEAWRAVSDLVVGFEGAPGHQGDNPVGSYDYAVKTVDRWDPVVDPGGVWDLLLGRGVRVHGALASSDFHAEGGDLNDYWPCRFSETWLRVPEVSGAGVLRALRAGTFVGVHGRIAREVELTVSLAGLPRPAAAGEVVEAPAGAVPAARVSVVVPATDWQGHANRIDRIEFHVTTPAGTSIIERSLESGAGAVEVTLPAVPPGGMAVRARGRRVIDDGPDLLFVTNAILIGTGRD